MGNMLFKFGDPTPEEYDEYWPSLKVVKWVNAFSSLGADAAAVLSPPDPSQWHPCNCSCFDSKKDPAIHALRTGTLEDVKAAFTEPRDLLRWMADPADDDSVISLSIPADVDMLKHLFQLSPKYFMQLMGIVSNTNGYVTTPLRWAIFDRKKELIVWMCESGVMTDALFQNCGDNAAGADGQMLSALDFAHSMDTAYGPHPAMKEIQTALQVWLALSEEERKGRTETLFIDDLCRTIVSLSVASLPSSGIVEVDCLAISGDAIGKINVDVSAPTLFENIAELIGKSKDSIVVMTPSGAALRLVDDLPPLEDMISKKV